jgi:hypothetical protein
MRYKKMKKQVCCPDIPEHLTAPCDEGYLKRPLPKIIYNTETKEVKDMWGNLLGIGEMKDGYLSITTSEL